MATLRQRWLAADLQRLRLAAGLSVKDVAERIGGSESTIQRIERGAYPPKERNLYSLLDLYNPDAHHRSYLVDLWHKGRQQGWWITYGDGIVDGTFLDLEDAASRKRTFEAQVVTGVLQTEDYARAVLEGVRPGDPSNTARLEVRMRRRLRFNTRSDPPELHVILDEAVVRRPIGGPDVMRDQIGYLRKCTELDHVTIQIVPWRVGGYVGLYGSFMVLGFDVPEFPEVGYVESRAGDLYPEDARTLAGFNIDFNRLIEVALSPEESATFLADILKE